MHRSPRTRTTRLVALVATLVVASTLVACQNGKVGGRCKAGTVAQDATHVLVCRNGKWSRLISKADGMRELARIQAEEAAKNQPPATQPPTTEPPTTQPPTTEPPATVPPTTAPVATVPPTTTAPTTTTSALPTTTTTPPTTTTTPATTTTVPSTTSTTTTVPPTTTSTVPPTTSTTSTTTTTTTTPASTGDLDTAFADNGRFRLDLPREGERVSASASSAGGTTYLLVPDTSGPGLAPLVRKVLASGDLDPTFGNGGVVRGPVASCFGCNLAVDDQNRLYVFGIEYQPGLSVFARVARFDELGRPDTTYGTNGVVSVQTSTQAIADVGPTGWFVVAESWMPRVTTVSPTGVTRAGFGGSVCLAFDLAVLPDGGSVVGSSSCTNQASTSVRVTRFDNRGEILPSFGTHDDLMTDLPGVSTLTGVNPSGVRTLALDSQDRTYVVTNREVRRLTTTGLHDTTYGGGVAVVPTIPGSDSLISVTMVGDLLHALVATDYRGGTGVVVAKLAANGAPDSSFGGDGLVTPSRYDATTVVPSTDYGTARLLRSGSGVIVQSSLYVADARIGRVLANGLLNLRSNGAEEPAYGDAGFATLRLAPVTTFLLGTFPGPSGSVYVHLGVAPSGVQVLVRVSASGALDSTFSGDGWMPADSATTEMTVDGAGRPVVFRTTAPVASMSFGNPPEPLERSITRYTTTGLPDTSFHAGDGAVTWPTSMFPTGSAGSCEALVTVLSDNSIVVAYPNQGPTTICSTMFDKVSATGGLTQGWGSGYAAIAGATPKLDSVEPAPNGRALVLVRSNTSGVAPRILRLNADGSADTSFGTGGGFDVADGAVVGQIDSLADGSVIVATTTAASMSFPDAAGWVRRYLPTGVQVRSGGYGSTGSAVLDLTQHLIVANGRLVGGGWSNTGRFSVLRDDATYDTSFPRPGDDGRATFGSGATRDVYPVVSGGRGFAVTGPTTSATVEIYKLAGTIG